CNPPSLVLTAGAHDTNTLPECQLTTPLLIDTDPGIDDALAILLAFGSPEVSVEAITTVAGNVEVNLCTENIFRVLDVVRPPRRRRPARRAGRGWPRAPQCLSASPSSPRRTSTAPTAWATWSALPSRPAGHVMGSPFASLRRSTEPI